MQINLNASFSNNFIADIKEDCLDQFRTILPKHIKFNEVRVDNLFEFKIFLDSHFNPALWSINHIYIDVKTTEEFDLL